MAAAFDVVLHKGVTGAPPSDGRNRVHVHRRHSDAFPHAASCIPAKNKKCVGQTYNIGTQKERTVMDVAHDVCRIFGADPGDRVRHVRDRAFNDRRCTINRYCLAPAFSISMHALGTPA